VTEYVFNAASNDGQNGGLHAATSLVAILVETLAELDDQLAGPPRPLKLPQNPWDLQVSVSATGEGVSLGEIINDFFGAGETRDLATFFDALQCYAPAADQLVDATIEAILRLEPTGSSPGFEAIYPAICAAGLDAMQCAVTDGTLVSLDHDRWNFDRAVVACGAQTVEIDHASRPAHVDSIVQRQLAAARAEVTRRNFEAIRHLAFPSLLWGEEVAGQLQRFPAEYLGLAFTRLAALDDMARRWQETGSANPDSGGLELKGESDLTMQNYSDERRFRSSNGDMRIYETHVWIDRGNRIHLILDNEQRIIEIGYIGTHLRTWNF